MKLIKLIAMSALITCTMNAAVFAENQSAASCPAGSELQFHQLATKYLGYWAGSISDGTSIESDNMTIPNGFYNDGYTVQFNNEISGKGFITCVYYLQDNMTNVKTPVFNVSSTIHH